MSVIFLFFSTCEILNLHHPATDKIEPQQGGVTKGSSNISKYFPCLRILATKPSFYGGLLVLIPIML
jgi:hypothetical protein